MQFNVYDRPDDVVLSNWLDPQHGYAPEAQRQHGQPVSTVTDLFFCLDQAESMVLLQ